MHGLTFPVLIHTQARSGCEIQIDQNFPDGENRKITVKGSPYNVGVAKDMIKTVMEQVRGKEKVYVFFCVLFFLWNLGIDRFGLEMKSCK